MQTDRPDIGRSGNFAKMFCAVSILTISSAIVHNALFNQHSRVFSASGVSISADSAKLDKLFAVLEIGPDSTSAGRTRMTVEPQQHDVLRTPAANSSELTLKAQQGLKRAGLYNGPVDGVLGERTRLAIRLYQRKNGLIETGRPDQRLIDHINYVRHIEQAATITGSIAPQLAPDTIMMVQRKLVRLGYDAGPADGRLGQRTRDALVAFQTDTQMTANGRITQQVLKRLAQ